MFQVTQLIGFGASSATLSAATFSFRSPALTDATNAASYSFPGADIGTANANRVVVVGAACDDTITALSIGGTAATRAGSEAVIAGVRVSIWYLPVASGTTATIDITVTSGARMAAVVWAVVPGASSSPLDVVTNTAATTTTVVASDLEINTGGVVLAMVGTNASGSTLSAAWGGADSVTEDADAALETARYGAYSFLTTESSSTADLTITSSGSANLGIVAVSFR